jgi:hypothetical protein
MDRRAYDTDLTDTEWLMLEPLFPAPQQMGGNAPGNPSSGVASLWRLKQLGPGTSIAQGGVQPNVVVPAQKSVGSIPSFLNLTVLLAEDKFIFQRAVGAL